MTWLAPLTLHGSHATLKPLSHEHHDDLVEAVKDGDLWNLWYTSVPTPDGIHVEIERRRDLQRQACMLPFAVIENAKNQAVGMTSYMNVDAQNRRLEIGGTWYRNRAQRKHGVQAPPFDTGDVARYEKVLTPTRQSEFLGTYEKLAHSSHVRIPPRSAA